jgi:rubrerythrin
MFGLKFTTETKQPKYHKYFKCDRCGYISIVKNSFCPICTKDGLIIKMK